MVPPTVALSVNLNSRTARNVENGADRANLFAWRGLLSLHPDARPSRGDGYQTSTMVRAPASLELNMGKGMWLVATLRAGWKNVRI